MSRVVLITGAATGLGAETARLLASEGWRIIVAARKEAAAQEVVALSYYAPAYGNTYKY